MSEEEFLLERNIIFLFPIGRNLKELKEELEKADNYNVFEADSISEFAQLINSLNKAVAFCSDLTKTTKTFESCEKLIKKREIKFILSTDQSVSPLVFGKLQKQGLQEAISGSLNKKAITYKLDFIYRTFEAKARALELKKQKEEQDRQRLLKLKEQKTETIKIDTTSKQNVEKGDYEEEHEDLGGLLKHNSNFKEKQKGALGLLAGKLGKNGEEDNSDMAMLDLSEGENNLQSHYANKLKKNANGGPDGGDLSLDQEGNEIEQEDLKRKKGVFEDEVEGFYKNKSKKLALVESDPEKKKGLMFDELDPESKKKNGKLGEVEDLDSKRKNGNLGEVDGPDRKKYENPFADLDPNQPKNGKIETPLEEDEDDSKYEDELEEYRRRKGLLKPVEQERKKASGDIDWNGEDEKERKRLKEVDREYERKKGFLDAQNEKERKPRVDLGPGLEHEQKSGKLPKVDLTPPRKNGKLPTPEDLARKKYVPFEKFDDPEKERKRLEEFERENNRKRVNFDGFEAERKKGMMFDDLESERKKHGFSEVYEDHHRKSNFKEGVIETYWGRKKQVAADKERRNLEELKERLQKKPRPQDEHIFNPWLEDEEPFYFEPVEIDEELEYNTYFPPDSQYAIFLSYLAQFYADKDLPTDKLCKFIQFILNKMKNGFVSYYQVSNGGPLREIFSGHKLNEKQLSFLGTPWENVVAQWGTGWAEIKNPWWSDHTWQDEVQTFVYPFYDGEKQLGLAVAHFVGTIKSEQDAKDVEVMVIGARGIFYVLS